MKYAIYSTDFGGYYAMRYIDKLKECKNLLGGHYIKKADLPIIVNRVGGRTSFDANDQKFVKIIECAEDAPPLTREQMYPKNSCKFEYGWIDTDGNTYSCAREEHWDAANVICEELGYSSYNGERTLEEKGWIKVTASYVRGCLKKRIFVEDFRITKAQYETLYNLGLHDLDKAAKALIERSVNEW